MAEPISSFSGLSSGIQWRDMIDAIIANERIRSLNPLDNEIKRAQARSTAWGSFGVQLGKLSGAAQALSVLGTFTGSKATASTSLVTGRTLLSATGGAGAAPGQYSVEVLGLAAAGKLGGAMVADAGAAAGVSGDVVINGKRVTLAASDSLNVIRDKINAANVGTDATRVTATILTAGPGQSRLVLTSQDTGAGGIDLLDSSSGALRTLGFTDGTVRFNIAADGQSQSARFTSAAAALGPMLGASAPATTSIKVGGATIAIDFAADSLNTIAAKFQAAGVGATVQTETVGGVTRSRLVTPAAVSVDPVDGGSAAALAALGFTIEGRGAVAQRLEAGVALTDTSTGVAATAATLIADLGTGAAVGDTITIRGTRADGSLVTSTFTVGAGSTVGDFLAALNAGTAFGGGTAPATASLVDGKLQIVDQQGGNSLLSLSLTANNEGGGSLSFGTITRQETGRQREIVAAQDARLKVDGAYLTRSSNTVADAIGGVTLALLQAEIGSPVTVTVAQDTQATADAIKAFAQAYNDTVSFVQQQRTLGGALEYDGVIRGALQQFTNILLADVPGLTGDIRRAGVVGVALDKAGVLQVDTGKLTEALTTNPELVRQVFAQVGQGMTPGLEVLASSSKTQGGVYSVNVTVAAQVASASGGALIGGYVDDGTADTLTIADPGGTKTTSISLASGDTLNGIVGKLNAAFQAQSMRLVADASTGVLTLKHLDPGSAASFTVAYTAGGTDGSAQLGLAAGIYAGVDIQGTINGNPATGVGNVLTGDAAPAGASAYPTEGLHISVGVGLLGAVGSVQNTYGVGAQFQRLVDALTSATGLVSSQQETLTTRISTNTDRKAAIEKRLEARQSALILQFSRMEESLSRIRGLTASLGGQWSTMSAGKGLGAG